MRQRVMSGMTLVEVLMALVVGMVMAGGVLMAFQMAARLSGHSVDTGEAVTYAIQTLEANRNKIACQQPGQDGTQAWLVGDGNPTHPCHFDPASPINQPVQADALPGGVAPSILGLTGTARNYEVIAGPDLDGNGQPDYYIVKGTVHYVEPQ